MIAITNTTIFLPTQDPTNTAILIENGKITALSPTETLSIPPDTKTIDGSDLLLVPGYIDLQLNGAFGLDFTADPTTIWEASARLPQFGVTSYLPTVITSPIENINHARRVLLEERPSDFSGSEPLGLHIEGPFLNPKKKGAHNPEYIQTAADSLIDCWSPEGGVRLVTLAPEMPGAPAAIEKLATRGTVVSAGHSMATYEEAQAGFAAGIRYGTHLFNAMSPLSHREPGLPGALLSAPNVVTGLIPDGIHVHPALIKIIWDAKGPQGLNLVSDAAPALGMKPGRYTLNEFEVIVSETECRLLDGTLAGSILPINTAVRNLIQFTGCSLSEALATVTTTPARLLGIDKDYGRIAPGHRADLLLLTPDLEVHTTIINGEIIYRV